jgi:hypothetical protein
MIFDSVTYYATSPPVFSLDKGADLIQLNNIISLQMFANAHGPQPTKQYPNAQPAGWGAATAAALDDERRLGAYDLDWNYGIAASKSRQ